MYNRNLERLGRHFRTVCKSIVGDLPGTDGTLEWHDIFHHRNVTDHICRQSNIKPWPRICGRLAQHTATL